VGAFFIMRDDGSAGSPAALARLLDAAAQQGFAAPAQFALPGWRAAVYPKLGGAPVASHADGNGNFAFATGTFIYRRQTGAAAVQAFLGRFDPKDIPWADMRGAFALVVGRGGELFVLGDRMGVYKIYRDEPWSVVSSSFLLALTAIASPRLDSQGVYEYVFEGATFGGRTVVDGVSLLDRRQVVALGQRVRLQAIPESRPDTMTRGAFDRHVARTAAELHDWFGEISDAFGGNLDTALSGGYDSRLILALARAHGRSPRVHVYGGALDPDVAVAKAIAAGEGFQLEHVDKSARPAPAPGDFAAVVERNMLAFDGYPPDGIFDGGGDLASRLDRCRGGALALNGGGGEIFRNFYYLRDGRYRVRDVLAAFHSQFDPASTTDAFAEDTYSERLAWAMDLALGRPIGYANDRLSRTEVEYLYPYFRCAYWMGRNNSVNGRLGHALTPFIDAGIVGGALQVPLAYKNHGRFEAALIAAIDPALARYPSAYGHDFLSPPPWRRRLKGALDLWKPLLLRRYSYRLKARLKAAQRPRLLQDDYLARAVDPALPAMAKFFRVGNLRAADQFARAATLEYLCRRFGISTG
jgi:hypothetical protein